MLHSAIFPTQNHALLACQVLPGNAQFAQVSVMIQDVSFNDASKISAEVARHGLSPLDWQPPITQPASPPPPPVVVPDPEPPETPEATDLPG